MILASCPCCGVFTDSFNRGLCAFSRLHFLGRHSLDKSAIHERVCSIFTGGENVQFIWPRIFKQGRHVVGKVSVQVFGWAMPSQCRVFRDGCRVLGGEFEVVFMLVGPVVKSSAPRPTIVP